MVKISSEEFASYIKHIKEQLEKDDKLSDVLVCEDTTGWISTAPHIIDDIVDLLEKIMGDEGEWISWFLWEVDSHPDNLPANNHIWVDDWNGKPYKFTIADAYDLYYFLTDDYEQIKEKVVEDAPKCDVHPTVDHPNFTGESLYDVFMGQMQGYTESDN